MTKGFTISVLALALAAVSCSHGVSRIRTRSLPSPNPTSYSFPLPVEEVHARALQAFSRDHQRKNPIFEQPPKRDYWESTLSVESVTNAVSGRDLFFDHANVDDFYLHASHKPVAISPVYRGRDGGLPFIAAFHVHLAGTASGPIVSVKATNTQVVNGMKYGLGSCGPGRHWNYVTVKPTTVEEYSILNYLGGYLGITNMPAVILPAQ